jgi:hypothetical protein
MWPNFGFSWGGFMDGILGVLVAFFLLLLVVGDDGAFGGSIKGSGDRCG